jgi:acyl dehydratase
VIDRKFIGTEAPVQSIEVEKYPIRFFALAIGETNPIHSDEQAAKAAGYRSIVAPLTYAACLNGMCADPLWIFREVGAPMERLLHGEQAYTYHRPIVAGDVLTFRTRVVDITEKKGGALELIETNTTATNQNGEPVVDVRAIVILRN